MQQECPSSSGGIRTRFPAAAALALDDLGVGHPAANGEESGGGSSDNKKLQDKMECDIWLAASSVDG